MWETNILGTLNQKYHCYIF